MLRRKYQEKETANIIAFDMDVRMQKSNGGYFMNNEIIAVFRNKAYIHRSETSLSSQKGKQSEKHVGLHSEEHPVS